MTHPELELTVGAVADVRFEHLRETLGMGTARPRLSWTVQTATEGWTQAAYEIQAFTPDGRLLAETGRVQSTESVLVAWPFAPLPSRGQVSVRVRAWGGDGQALAWSELAPAETGLLSPDDWSAAFITPAWPAEKPTERPAPMFRREFALKGTIRQARLYISALGVYGAEINGRPVGDHVLAPGWTSYTHRLRYQTFDVTSLLAEGPNALAATVGAGWFRGRMGFGGGRPNIYGDRAGLLAQLEVTYADGSTERIVTDTRWRAAIGPLCADDIYDGESYDARLERPGWSQAGYDEAGWSAVETLDWDLGRLVAPAGPPVRRTQEIAPVSISQSPSGRTLVDFGQNLVGWLRIRVQGPAGQTVTFRHAEVLEEGELGTRPLRHARATDQYTLKGGAVETWEPRFTFHGFRYAEVEGWPGELKADDLVAVVCHSDMQRTGWFECSDPLINRLHENVVWGMRGNFLDIPTDCPQRDERLGWTGDIQVFSPTATFLYDCAGFLGSWLADVAADQGPDGAVPHVVPNIMGPARGAAAWGDAAVVVPWVLYQRFGDASVLEDQFASMAAWVDYVDRAAGESHRWDRGFQFGDWLDPAAPPDNPGAARTDKSIVATAYFARSAEIVALAASALGKAEAAERYSILAAQARAAFQDEYVTPNGRMMNDATTAYALALEFALLPEPAQRERAGKRLVELARASGYHISTGFVGTPLVCDALCSAGAYTAAYRLLTQRTCPSWLYPVTMGATTIWERWDSMLPDGSINPGEMTSFNHYALGAVADWMHRTVAGLAPAALGYRRLAIAPHPGGKLTHARAKHLTPYGMAEAGWRIEDGQIHVEAVVPPNTTAQVTLPGAEAAIEVGSGTHRWSVPYEGKAAVKPLSLDSTLADIYDDEEVWEAFIAAAKEAAPQFANRMQHAPAGEMPLRMIASFMQVGPAIAEAFERVLAQLGRK